MTGKHILWEHKSGVLRYIFHCFQVTFHPSCLCHVWQWLQEQINWRELWAGSHFLKWTQSVSLTFLENTTRTLSSLIHGVLRGNGLVFQIETSPEISLIYRVCQVMIIHNFSAADMLCKGAKILLKFWMYCSYSHQCAHVWQQHY